MSGECYHVELMLSEYVLGGLTSDERMAVEDHVDRCPACSASLTELQQIGEGLLHSPPPVEPSVYKKLSAPPS